MMPMAKGLPQRDPVAMRSNLESVERVGNPTAPSSTPSIHEELARPSTLHAVLDRLERGRQARSIAFVERFVDQRADRNVALEQPARQPSGR